MDFLARIFRFLFWTLVLSWGIWLLKRLFNSQVQAAHSPESDAGNTGDSGGRRLVRDPECGMHVAEQLAIPVRMGNEMIHFCSPECRDRYLQQTHKLAANG
jgi:hypothetical protein